MIFRRIVGLRNEKSGKNGPLSRICSRFILSPTGCEHLVAAGKVQAPFLQGLVALGWVELNFHVNYCSCNKSEGKDYCSYI